MTPCKRCTASEAVLVSRKEHFCNDCFIKFVSLKQRKQLMSDDYFQDIFKMAYADKKRNQEEADLQNSKSNVLVALSLGSSSLSVLDVLNDTLCEQKKSHRGKTGFQVEVLKLCHGSERDNVCEKITGLKEKYHDNLDKIKFHVVERKEFFNGSSELQEFKLFIDTYQTYVKDIPTDRKQELSVEDIILNAPNKTSREDLLNVIDTHLIKKFALQHGFKAIVWGHSMTKLADEIISLTVKGRGAEIPHYLDNSSLDEEYNEGFRNLHPARDALLSELDAYCHIKSLSSFCYQYTVQDTLFLDKFVDKSTKNVKLIKSMTMNELARQYFDNIEGDYSNVISTVVRTGAKLAYPNMEMEHTNENKRCDVCNAIIYKNPVTWLDGITVNKAYEIQDEEEQANYEAWGKANNSDSQLSLQELQSEFPNKSNICYGCISTLTGMKNRKLEWIKRDETELSNILQEYEL